MPSMCLFRSCGCRWVMDVSIYCSLQISQPFIHPSIQSIVQINPSPRAAVSPCPALHPLTHTVTSLTVSPPPASWHLGYILPAEVTKSSRPALWPPGSYLSTLIDVWLFQGCDVVFETDIFPLTFGWHQFWYASLRDSSYKCWHDHFSHAVMFLKKEHGTLKDRDNMVVLHLTVTLHDILQ